MHNQLLLSILADAPAGFAERLKRVPLTRGMVLHETGRTVERAYFPESGAVSLVVDLAGGEIIETALVGTDGVVGGEDTLLHSITLSRAMVQIEGSALVIEADALQRVCTEKPELRTLIRGYERFICAQAQQTAACNAVHSLDARLARWLLRAHDLCGNGFALTQEALAAFLGVRRTSVSLTAHGFQSAGMIRYRRGVIEIVDAGALQALACECHAALAAHRARLLPRPAARKVPARDVG